MKSKLIIFLIAFIFASCKSYIVNSYFEKNGIYDEKVKLEKLTGENDIVFVPMHHIGTKNFYDDVKNKVDSLVNNNHIVFYEMIMTDNAKSTDTTLHKKLDTVMLKKFRKVFGLFGSEKGGRTNYVDFFKEKNIKMDKELVPQPKLAELGLKNKNSINVDITLDELVRKYEKKYGPIILENYDYNTKLSEKYDSKKNNLKIDKKIKDEFILQERNNTVLQKIKTEKNKKIAIVYGKNHFIGIKDSLQKMGYKLIN